MKKLCAAVVGLMLLVQTAAPKKASAGETENVLAIIFGATVAMFAISAFNETTNGKNAMEARIGVTNIEADAYDYLATEKAGPSLIKAYQFAVKHSGIELSMDEYARNFVENADALKAAVSQ